MLIRFELENWRSFQERAEFSMVATKERHHGERVPRIRKYQTRALPVAAIYGGNASGKTNLCRALNFVRQMVVQGTSKPKALIPVEPFRLEAKARNEPSRFLVVLFAAEKMYEFSFAATPSEFVEERLTEITSSTEKTLYTRDQGSIHFHPTLRDNARLGFAFEGTRPNQLFLTNSVLQNLDVFRPVYDWFNETLELLAPDSRFQNFERFIQEDHDLYATMNDMLARLDTGIRHLGGESVELDQLPLPEEMKKDVAERARQGETVRIRLEGHFNENIVLECDESETVKAKRVVSFHRGSHGKDVRFEIKDESDGTRRIIDLLPAFLELGKPHQSKVYVIDELDRSLHSQLTLRLLQCYLDSCSTDTRNQLIFTTHDLLVMDQDLLRRDEMWLVDSNDDGGSGLIAVSEYQDARHDKDIRKSYLQGRMGGVPHLGLWGRLPEMAEVSG